MHTFIDESGKFKVPSLTTGKADYECIIALVISDSLLAQLNDKYGSIEKFALRTIYAPEIIALIASGNATALAIVNDADQCTELAVDSFRKRYISSIFEGQNHPQWMLDSVNRHAKNLSDCSRSQFLKTYLIMQLLENVARMISNSSRRFQEEDLQHLIVTCDDITKAMEPIIKYFYFFSLCCSASAEPLILDDPKRLATFIHSSGKYFDARCFFKNIDFINSKDSVGIKIADVIANQLYRLLHGKSLNCDPKLLQELFSMPYSFDFMHFGEINKFSLNQSASEWLNTLTEQTNL